MKVPVLSMLCMVLAGLASLAIPIALFFFFRKKKRADILPFFIGCAVMFLFALVLEALIHQLVFLTPPGKAIQENIWLYALFGGLMAGLFEETGRFVAFKTVLRRYRGRDINALMYGAGHGGFEAAAVFGGAMVNNLLFAVLLNTGLTGLLTKTLPAEQLPQFETVFEALRTTPWYGYFPGLLERVIAVALHLALTVPVWFAAKNGKKWYLYPVAVLLHFAADAGIVLLSRAGLPLLAVYGCFAAYTALAAGFAVLVWKKNRKGEPQHAVSELS